MTEVDETGMERGPLTVADVEVKLKSDIDRLDDLASQARAAVHLASALSELGQVESSLHWADEIRAIHGLMGGLWAEINVGGEAPAPPGWVYRVKPGEEGDHVMVGTFDERAKILATDTLQRRDSFTAHGLIVATDGEVVAVNRSMTLGTIVVDVASVEPCPELHIIPPA